MWCNIALSKVEVGHRVETIQQLHGWRRFNHWLVFIIEPFKILATNLAELKVRGKRNVALCTVFQLSYECDKQGAHFRALRFRKRAQITT